VWKYGDIQSATAEIRREKKKEEEETTGQKYNGLPITTGRHNKGKVSFVSTYSPLRKVK